MAENDPPTPEEAVLRGQLSGNTGNVNQAFAQANLPIPNIDLSATDQAQNADPFATDFDDILIPLDENKLYATGPIPEIPVSSTGVPLITLPPEQAAEQVYNKENLIGYQNYRMIPTTWTPEQRRNFIREGILRGIPGFDKDMSMMQILDVWDDFTRIAMRMNADSDTPENNAVTVFRMHTAAEEGDLGTKVVGDWEIDIATGERVRYVGPREITTTDVGVDLSSPEEAKYIVTQALQQLLGRDPYANEIGTFYNTLRSAEEASPEAVTTTTTLDEMGKKTGSASVTTGGVSNMERQQMAVEQTKRNPEYGAYQAATTYMNALKGMIFGGP